MSIVCNIDLSKALEKACKSECLWIGNQPTGTHIPKPKTFVVGNKLVINGDVYEYSESLYNLNSEQLFHVYKKIETN